MFAISTSKNASNDAEIALLDSEKRPRRSWLTKPIVKVPLVLFLLVILAALSNSWTNDETESEFIVGDQSPVGKTFKMCFEAFALTCPHEGRIKNYARCATTSCKNTRKDVAACCEASCRTFSGTCTPPSSIKNVRDGWCRGSVCTTTDNDRCCKEYEEGKGCLRYNADTNAVEVDANGVHNAKPGRGNKWCLNGPPEAQWHQMPYQLNPANAPNAPLTKVWFHDGCAQDKKWKRKVFSETTYPHPTAGLLVSWIGMVKDPRAPFYTESDWIQDFYDLTDVQKYPKFYGKAGVCGSSQRIKLHCNVYTNTCWDVLKPEGYIQPRGNSGPESLQKDCEKPPVGDKCRPGCYKKTETTCGIAVSGYKLHIFGAWSSVEGDSATAVYKENYAKMAMGMIQAAHRWDSSMKFAVSSTLKGHHLRTKSSYQGGKAFVFYVNPLVFQTGNVYTFLMDIKQTFMASGALDPKKYIIAADWFKYMQRKTAQELATATHKATDKTRHFDDLGIVNDPKIWKEISWIGQRWECQKPYDPCKGGKACADQSTYLNGKKQCKNTKTNRVEDAFFIGYHLSNVLGKSMIDYAEPAHDDLIYFRDTCDTPFKSTPCRVKKLENKAIVVSGCGCGIDSVESAKITIECPSDNGESSEKKEVLLWGHSVSPVPNLGTYGWADIRKLGMKIAAESDPEVSQHRLCGTTANPLGHLWSSTRDLNCDCQDPAATARPASCPATPPAGTSSAVVTPASDTSSAVVTPASDTSSAVVTPASDTSRGVVTPASGTKRKRQRPRRRASSAGSGTQRTAPDSARPIGPG